MLLLLTGKCEFDNINAHNCAEIFCKICDGAPTNVDVKNWEVLHANRDTSISKSMTEVGLTGFACLLII